MSGTRPMGREPSLLCAAFSARQIAESARLSGYRPLAVDFFADLDLSAAAGRSELVTGHYPDGFTDDDLLAALGRVAEGEAPIGFVYGAGFEDRPHLLEAIRARWPVLGTDPDSLRRLKDPAIFASLCADAGVAHPPIAQEIDGAGRWVSKQVAGCGGSHVRWADQDAPEVGPGRYYQRHVGGERWSALFLAARGRTEIVGFSRQWADASEEEPFRYGGAVGPIDPPAPLGERLDDDLARLVRAASDRGILVRGLASADFVVAETRTFCLEINPRFGATIDVFDDPAAPLMAAHLAACRGELANSSPRKTRSVRAAGLAWARQETMFPADFVWPDWTHDRSRLPKRFAAGEPIATVIAEADAPDGAKARFDAYVERLRCMGRGEATDRTREAGGSGASREQF